MQWLIGRKVVNYNHATTRIMEIEVGSVVLIAYDSTGATREVTLSAITPAGLCLEQGPDPDLEAARVLIDKIKEGDVNLEGLRFPVSTPESSAPKRRPFIANLPRFVEPGEVDEESLSPGSIRIENDPDGTPRMFVMVDGGWSALGGNEGPSGSVAHGVANGFVLPHEPDSGSFARGSIPPHDSET